MLSKSSRVDTTLWKMESEQACYKVHWRSGENCGIVQLKWKIRIYPHSLRLICHKYIKKIEHTLTQLRSYWDPRSKKLSATGLSYQSLDDCSFSVIMITFTYSLYWRSVELYGWFIISYNKKILFSNKHYLSIIQEISYARDYVHVEVKLY